MAIRRPDRPIARVAYLDGPGTNLSYTLRRRNRRTIGLVVYPDGRVEIRAPRSVPITRIEQFLNERASWIDRKRRQFAQLPEPPEPMKWRDGEVIHILGQPRRLVVTEDPTAPRHTVTDCGESLRVAVRNAESPDSVRRTVDRWLRSLAEDHLRARVRSALSQPSAEALATNRWRFGPDNLPPVTVRRMKRRWGSCHADGRLTFNLELITAEPRLIDYVVVHELCHLVELNHSRRFYALMDRVLPDWPARKQTLNRTVPIGKLG